MGYIYSSLDRGADEDQFTYDNRIIKMLPMTAGRAYFDLRNYNAQTGEFYVYIEWDEDINRRLAYPLPSGGYFVKTTISQAYIFHRLECGLPVYMKFVSRGSGLYPYRTFTMLDGRPYSVEFGGGELRPFEERYEELGCKQHSDGRDETAGSRTGSSVSSAGSGRFVWSGSRMRELFGSQGGFRMLFGSQRGLRLLSGSQRYVYGGSGMRMLSGSQRGLHLLSGSQRYVYGGSGMRMIFGSQRYMSGGSGMRMLSGSQSGLRQLSGSQRYISGGSSMRMFSGSQRGLRLLSGSQIRGVLISDHQGVFDMSNRIPELHSEEDLSIGQKPVIYEAFPAQWQLINRHRRPTRRIGGNAAFGYGLDLI